MWYTNNSKTNHEINSSFYKFAENPKEIWNPAWPNRKYEPKVKLNAGYNIEQIDDKYIGVYNGSYLMMVIPAIHNGVKLDPKLITGVEGRKDSYEFNYPDASGALKNYFGRIDQDGITSEYRFNDISNKVVRTDLRADADRMKEQEQKLNSMYFQFVTLANNFVKQGFNKNKIKEDLYFRILNLVQTGQIDEQTGMTLNSWLGKLESLDTSEPKTQEQKDLDEKELIYEGEEAFKEYDIEIKDPSINRNVLLNEINTNIFMTEAQKQILRDKIK